MSYEIRIANINDIDFLAKVIIEAEKSGTDKIGLANVFNITESELKSYLVRVLDEEIDGCEYSLSSFLIANFKGEPVAAFGGWVELENENNQPSSILKSNLIGYVFPADRLKVLKENQNIIKDLIFDREAYSHQLEFAYVDKDHRGKGLTKRIIESLLDRAKTKCPNVKKSQVQVYGNNKAAIAVYRKSGYSEVQRKESKHPSTLEYLPDNVKLVLEKKI